MAPSRENHDYRNDAVSSDPITEETTAIPTVPFEIVEEILIKLPVKFLMQLKSVCKSWKSLISDSKFAKKHLRVSTTRHHILVSYITNLPRKLILEGYPREFILVDYPFSFDAAVRQLDFPLSNRNRFESFDFIVGSCHGIICFVLDRYSPLLWNPSIRKFMKLPPSFVQEVELCYTHYGFGYVYDRFNDNYIYKDFPYGIPLHPCGTFVSGTVNWWVTNDPHTSHVIISLDLDKESYQQIMQPDYGLKSVVRRNLAVLRDCLSILALNYTFSDVWLMKEFGNKESWTKLFRIPFGDVESTPYIRPLYLFEDDQVLLECKYELQSKRQVELAIYDSRDSTLKTAEIQKSNCSMVYEVYQESFIMPCS
ncbi:hypothetical protein TSUD_381810 [Trifolium subterraneum]|uniref:F-box domain-containing protein n=1 Tax=Trifolium subterraneum TaxID=3900 RepID=A0A2Z6LP50_TRISU|nr:hypothetical protein TSUD_381810 [Trifolium subterraneum]